MSIMITIGTLSFKSLNPKKSSSWIRCNICYKNKLYGQNSPSLRVCPAVTLVACNSLPLLYLLGFPRTRSIFVLEWQADSLCQDSLQYLSQCLLPWQRRPTSFHSALTQLNDSFPALNRWWWLGIEFPDCLCYHLCLIQDHLKRAWLRPDWQD